MNQIIKEECPYCENYVTGQMRDTMARKATRWVAKKGITGTIEHVGNSFTGYGGTIASTVIKKVAGDELDKAGKYAESKMFEIGEFDFSCPHCGRVWYREIPHSQGNITIQIDHDYVDSKRKEDVKNNIIFSIISLLLAAIPVVLLYLYYTWCCGFEQTTTVYSEGFLGIGEGYHEEYNMSWWWAWASFYFFCMIGVIAEIYIMSWFFNAIGILTTEYKEYRFNLLTGMYDK